MRTYGIRVYMKNYEISNATKLNFLKLIASSLLFICLRCLDSMAAVWLIWFISLRFMLSVFARFLYTTTISNVAERREQIAPSPECEWL